MGANISYRQVKPIDGVDLPVCAPSYFIETMQKAFGRFPCYLSEQDIPVLIGMAATCSDLAEEKYGNPYNYLIKGIKKLGSIEVYAEY